MTQRPFPNVSELQLASTASSDAPPPRRPLHDHIRVHASRECRHDSLYMFHAQREHAYEAWRQQVKEAAEATSPERTARGNSIVIESGGITARGAGHKIAQGYAAIKQIAGGAQHFAAVHQSGALYTWGLGSGGRLGLDITENGDPRADATRPTVVQALASTPVLTTACGYSHMACVTTSRDLYVWGSAASGKLGLGLAAKEEGVLRFPTGPPATKTEEPTFCTDSFLRSSPYRGHDHRRRTICLGLRRWWPFRFR